MLRDLEDGLVIANDGYTVAQAVEDWLTYGLSNRDPATHEFNRRLCEKHVIPLLGAPKLREMISQLVGHRGTRAIKTTP